MFVLSYEKDCVDVSCVLSISVLIVLNAMIFYNFNGGNYEFFEKRGPSKQVQSDFSTR